MKLSDSSFIFKNIPLSIQEIDLTNVKRKLMEPEPEGKKWNTYQVTEAELWYKRYLSLCLKYSEEAIVPNYPIDTFWHQHILDTYSYANDCEKIFGKFLHHYPYFGLNGDEEELENSFIKTNLLYRIEFGEDCTEMKTDFRSKANMLANSCKVESCRQGCRVK